MTGTIFVVRQFVLHGGDAKGKICMRRVNHDLDQDFVVDRSQLYLEER